MFPLGDGLGVFVRDVTDRRNAEKQREEAEDALRKRSAELEAVLETIPTAVWFTTDRELRHVIGNRRAIELLRIPRELDLSSALNRPVGFTVFREGIELPTEERPLHRAARGETVPEELLEVRFDNGDRKMLLMRAAPLRSESGDLQGGVAAAADVTERHALRGPSQAAAERAQSPGEEHAGDRAVDRDPDLEGRQPRCTRSLRGAAVEPQRGAQPADRRETGTAPASPRSSAPRCAPPANG